MFICPHEVEVRACHLFTSSAILISALLKWILSLVFAIIDLQAFNMILLPLERP